MDTVGLLGQCRIVAVLDMASGYLQVQIEERDRENLHLTNLKDIFTVLKCTLE